MAVDQFHFWQIKTFFTGFGLLFRLSLPINHRVWASPVHWLLPLITFSLGLIQLHILHCALDLCNTLTTLLFVYLWRLWATLIHFVPVSWHFSLWARSGWFFRPWSLASFSSGDFCPGWKLQEHTGQTCNNKLSGSLSSLENLEKRFLEESSEVAAFCCTVTFYSFQQLN